jgi:hypothetical protein
MILEILLIIGIIVGFLNSRSTTLADRALSGQYFIEGKSGFLNLLIAVLMFLGMISTFAIIIWGFIYLTWYFSVIGLVLSIILSQRNLVGKIMPFQDSIHIIMNVLVVTINGYLWVIKLL